MTTDPKTAQAFCEALYEALVAELTDVDAVRDAVERLRAHAPTFPESRFCKGCILPVVDRVANTFLADHAAASRADVHRALRCEGFANLRECYVPDMTQTGFSSFTQVRTPQATEGRLRKFSRFPSPDFCIRFVGPPALRVVGEVKYAPTGRGSPHQVRDELVDYLSITHDPATDWGHDFGFGLTYSAAGNGDRAVRLHREWWDADRIVVAEFVARG